MKIGKLLCLILFFLLVAGCGFKDIDKRFFVVSMGIDKAEKKDLKYKVTLKLALPSTEAKSTGSDFILLEKESDTITEAIRKLKTEIDKELDFGHAKVILFGKDLAKKDLLRDLDWFIRRRDIQKIAYVAIGSPTAKSILEVKPKSERIPSNALFLSFGETGSETPYTVTEYLFDLRKRLIEPGLDPFLPVIKAKKDLFVIDQIALFDKHSLKVYLNDEQTKIVHALMMKVKKSDIGIKGEGYHFVISTNRISTDYKIVAPEGKKPLIEVKAKIEGIVEESRTVIDDSERPKLEELAEKAINHRILETLQLLQKHQVDPIGFGVTYRAHHFGSRQEEIEEWKRIYPEVEFKVDAKVTIAGLGIIQ